MRLDRQQLMKGVRLLVLAAGGFLSWTASAAAEPPTLSLPIDCTLGVDCWITNLVDLDPTSSAHDYACGASTYDGHKGIDFAIRDLGVMRRGVNVLAAAPGVVTGIRDGMADINVRKIGRDAVQGRECGNGVAIQHADGWTTQYCHLRKGSVVARKGMRVQAGAKLGLVGYSGLSEFPHVHIQLRHGNKVVDPFFGKNAKKPCGTPLDNLWKKDLQPLLEYQPTAIYNHGFAAKAPKAALVREGFYQNLALSRSSPALIFWIDIFYVKPGDHAVMTLRAPDGTVLIRHNKEFKNRKAQQFLFAGLRRKGVLWSKGTYTGEAVLTRKMKNGRTQVFRTEDAVTLR